MFLEKDYFIFRVGLLRTNKIGKKFDNPYKLDRII